MFAGSIVDTADMPKDHNKGGHRIYASGKYDSLLYAPIIPNKKQSFFEQPYNRIE